MQEIRKFRRAHSICLPLYYSRHQYQFCFQAIWREKSLDQKGLPVSQNINPSQKLSSLGKEKVKSKVKAAKYWEGTRLSIKMWENEKATWTRKYTAAFDDPEKNYTIYIMTEQTIIK